MNTERGLDSARRLAERDPVKVLQSYYRFLEEDKKVAQKQEFLKKYHENRKVLDWQVRQAREAKRKQDAADMKAIQEEFRRSEAFALEQKKKEKEKRLARIQEFKERELERSRVVAERERRKKEEREREKLEVRSW